MVKVPWWWWFAAALAVFLAVQIIRLNQSSAAGWLLWDYSARLAVLALLAAIPAARRVAFARGPAKVGRMEILMWTGALTVGFVILEPLVGWLLGPVGGRLRLSDYPQPDRLLWLIDMTFGLALVACHEEIVFRRCAAVVLGKQLGQGALFIGTSAALFAAHHWWSGIAAIVSAALFGAAAMLLFRETGRLRPLMVAHYIIDLVDFG